MGRRDLGGIGTGTGESSLTVNEAVTLRIPGMQTALQMYVHGPEDKHVSRKIREQGLWEPFETSLIVSRLNTGDVFVDVGANIGYFTLIAASLVGDQGQVYAFEPDPENYRLLEKNCAHNFSQLNVHAVCGGCSRRPRHADRTGRCLIVPRRTCADGFRCREWLRCCLIDTTFLLQLHRTGNHRLLPGSD